MSNPTLINLPPPPSDPITPSEVPSRSGTPNSTTTSMSELSTVAIKDGHRGHNPHHHTTHHQASGLSNQLDAERADRISRLAGLERVTTARGQPNASHLTPSAVPQPVQSYFDASGNPTMNRERSTVGSASATGSVGARTTWAGSEAGDTSNFDKMSESQDMDMDTSSVGGMSDEGTPSLVGFGEGARTPARYSAYGTPGKGSASTPKAYDTGSMDGMDGVVTGGVAAAERIVRENMNTTSQDRMTSHNEASPTRGGDGPELGKFGFEK